MKQTMHRCVRTVMCGLAAGLLMGLCMGSGCPMDGNLNDNSNANGNANTNANANANTNANTNANANSNANANGNTNDNANSNANTNSNTNSNDNSGDPAVILQIKADDHVMGDPNAPNIIIEYSDFQCPACGSFFRNDLDEVEAQLIDTGRARFVFRHFPLSSIHEFAFKAAEAAECASAGMFFAYHDLLFQNQDALTEADLIDYANQLGLNVETFTECLDSSLFMDRVQRDLDEGRIVEVGGTPTFFVNGNRLEGSQTVEDMEPFLE